MVVKRFCNDLVCGELQGGAPSLASDSPYPRIAFSPTRFRSPHRNGLAEIRHFVM
jgi:hypothetical protein